MKDFWEKHKRGRQERWMMRESSREPACSGRLIEATCSRRPGAVSSLKRLFAGCVLNPDDVTESPTADYLSILQACSPTFWISSWISRDQTSLRLSAKHTLWIWINSTAGGFCNLSSDLMHEDEILDSAGSVPVRAGFPSLDWRWLCLLAEHIAESV